MADKQKLVQPEGNGVALKDFIAELSGFGDRLQDFAEGLPDSPPHARRARVRARIECVLHDHIVQAVRDLISAAAELEKGRKG